MGARLDEEAVRFEEAGNRAVEGAGALYAAHRARFTEAVMGLAPRGAVALLGAGNCHDVDLTALCRQFDAVHLVDLDGKALGRAIDRQPADIRGKLVAHAPVDLTGLLSTPGALDGAPERLVSPAIERVVAALPRGLAAVASACVLTQMAFALERRLHPGQPLRPELARAVLAIHLGTMAALLAPGGGALLATDLISSDSYPLDELGADRAAALVPELLASGNYFTVADPRIASRLLRRDPALAAACTEGRALPPWHWTAPKRTYLVHALTFARRG